MRGRVSVYVSQRLHHVCVFLLQEKGDGLHPQLKIAIYGDWQAHMTEMQQVNLQGNHWISFLVILLSVLTVLSYCVSVCVGGTYCCILLISCWWGPHKSVWTHFTPQHLMLWFICWGSSWVNNSEHISVHTLNSSFISCHDDRSTERANKSLMTKMIKIKYIKKKQTTHMVFWEWSQWFIIIPFQHSYKGI